MSCLFIDFFEEKINLKNRKNQTTQKILKKEGCIDLFLQIYKSH